MNRYLFTFLLLSSFVFGQNSSFIYQLKYKPDSDVAKTENITYYLDVKGTESLFRSVMFRRSDSLRAKRGLPEGYDPEFNNKQLYVAKNTASDEVKKYVFVPMVYKTYAINITDKLEWKITGEKQTIGSYPCQKAEVNYGGRNWYAWFTTEIILHDGPYIFKGLPGLIVKINDEKSDYQFELVQIKSFEWKALYPEKIQKIIAWDDYQKLQKSFYNDPFSTLKKSDINTYDDSGNLIKTDFKGMREGIQRRIRTRNNPIELTYKIEY